MKRRWLRYSLTALIILLLIFAVMQFDAQSLWHSMTQIPLWSFVLLLGLQIVTMFLISIQWKQVAKYANVSLSLGSMLYINCQGAIVDSVTPGVKFGGEVTRAVQIRNMGDYTVGQAASVVALQKIFSLSAFFFVNIFAAGILVSKVSFLQAGYLQFLIFGILALLLAMFACIFIIPHKMQAYLQTRKDPRFSWMLKIRRFMISLLSQVCSIRENKKALVSLLLFSIFIWLIYPLKMYLLTTQLFPDASIILVGAIAFAAYMVAMIPIFPGGLGGFEGTMTGLLLAVGAMQSDALVITVLFRFATFWFVMLLSLAFIGLYKIYKKRVERVNDQAQKKHTQHFNNDEYAARSVGYCDINTN